jgi:molybdopterin molybdotransferase
MITVAEAKALIGQHTKELSPVELPLNEAAGKILAQDIFASADMPPFPQSSMDGYAFSFRDWQRDKPLIIDGEIPAGAKYESSLSAGKAARIFTGAPVPHGADTVVMQEKTEVEGPSLLILDELLQQGANVRPAGSEIKKNALALPAGKQLSAAAIGFVAGLGIASAKVFPNPSVTIIITGDELQQPGRALDFGQVYESNSYSLVAALNTAGITAVSVVRSSDNLDKLSVLLHSSLEKTDLVLLTGGVSVGDYDFVLSAAANCGVDTIFHKIKQRPGKPLFFGKKGDKLVFGLPGNPSSVLSCFYEYVLTAMSILTKRDLALKVITAPLEKTFKKNAPLSFFLKGWYDGEKVRVLDAQESYKLSSFAKSNCLVKIDEDSSVIEEGAMVEIHLLPQ